MARYMPRRPEVEATQFSNETFGPLVRSIPAEWFAGANGDEPLYLLIRLNPAVRETAKAAEGDWIVKDADGGYEVYSDEEFAKRFAAVPAVDDAKRLVE